MIMNENVYITITIASCVISIIAMFFAVLPWVLIFKVMRWYKDIVVTVSELTQDNIQTTRHLATVINTFNELVNKNTA